MATIYKWILAGAMGLATAAFYAAPARAQDAPTSQPTTQPSGTATVTVNDANGKPVSGVTVSVTARRGRRGAQANAGATTQPARGGRGAAVASGKTDDRGVANLSDLAPGNYTATVRTSDGQRGSTRFTVSADDASPVAVTITLGVTAGRGGGGGGGGNAGGGN